MKISSSVFLIASWALTCVACANTPAPSCSPSISTPAPVVETTVPLGELPIPPSDYSGATEPKDPIEYGVCKLGLAAARAKTTSRVSVLLASDPAAAAALTAAKATLDVRAESYAIVPSGDASMVIGRDRVGAMYGALDVAERLDLEGATALPIRAAVTAAPATAIRGANPFLVLPIQGEAGTWWFDDPAFWTEFLDMMARARLNFLDMHGMEGFYKAVPFPNALLWFANSASFPDVGAPRNVREIDLAMLRHIVEMARARGIQVGLMSYRADLSPFATKEPSELDEPQIETYTREAVADLVTRAPGLTYFGFRVGETHRKPDWYTRTFVAGLQAARSPTALYTRTWLTPKNQLLGIVEAAGPNTIVEAKYNGEHFGPPYVISGANMTHWTSYSYQNYLDPPTPYRFVFQIRAGGTHRIFRYASYERTARAVRSLAISPRVSGFTFEAGHAYGPQRDFYHANPADAFSPWTFRRDEMAYLLFGRLGYDPATPEKVFRGMLAARVGTGELWDAVQAASDIVPWIQTAFTCGPDQRDYAPELELGGDVAFWASPTHEQSNETLCQKGHFAFDGFAVALPYEFADDLAIGRGTSRLSPLDVADVVLADARTARGASKIAIDPANAEARDYARECVALADLGEWFGHKLRGATALAVYERTGANDWLDAAKSETVEADAAFTTLAADTAYIAPFYELIRMRKLKLSPFHWREELPLLAADPASIASVAEAVRARPPKPASPPPRAQAWLDAPHAAGPGLTDLTISPPDPKAPSWTVAVTLATPLSLGQRVNVLYRPFASDAADWLPVSATGSGAAWKATVPGTGSGGMFAVEIDGGPGRSFRYPDVRRETPYRALAP